MALDGSDDVGGSSCEGGVGGGVLGVGCVVGRCGGDERTRRIAGLLLRGRVGNARGGGGAGKRKLGGRNGGVGVDAVFAVEVEACT